MNAPNYFQEIDHFLDSYKLQVENEKKEIAECQKKFSDLVNTFSQKTPSSNVINSLFKDEEPEGFVFSKYEEKRKELAEQRRAEYNAYLEKKDAEHLSKKRINQEKKNISPKSILDSVDYERVLAKRKEEEAKFRDQNIVDILYHSQPILNEEPKKTDLNVRNSSYVSPRIRSLPAVNISKTASVSEDVNAEYPEFEEKKNMELLYKENVKLLEERVAKQLEEKRHQMLLQFENELQKNNTIKEEIQSMKSSSSSVKSSPQRRIVIAEEIPNFGRTGGGGDPVRDSYGNLLTMRGQRRKGSADYGSIMSFPSMQQQPVKDRMVLYREELQKQIEEKKRSDALARARAQDEEQRIAQRYEEQKLKMLEEYENEQKKNNKIKEEFQRQQERIRRLEEFQRKDAEARCRKLPEVRALSPAPQPVMQERSKSPPIPAVRTKVLLEKVVEAVPEVVQPGKAFSSLAEIRRKIMEEQQKSKHNHKKSYEVMNRRTVQEISDDEDDDTLKTSTNSFSQF